MEEKFTSFLFLNILFFNFFLMTKLIGLLRRIGGGLVAACLVAAVGGTSVWAWSLNEKLELNSAGDIIRQGGVDWFYRDNNDLQWWQTRGASGIIRIANDSGGNFAELDVRSNTTNFNGKLELNSAGDIIRQGGVDWFYRDNNDLQWWQTRGASGIIRIANDSGGNFAELDIRSNTTNFNGNVGIGTTSPTGKLTVKNDDSNLLDIDTSWGGVTTLEVNTSDSAGADGRGQLRLHGSNGTHSQIGLRMDGPLWVDEGSQTWLSGNVGIGTTNPTEKLEVSGSMKISGDITTSGDIKTSGDICIGRCAQ